MFLFKHIEDRMKTVVPFAHDTWHGDILPTIQIEALEALEQGGILLFEQLPFRLSDEEKYLLDPTFLAPKSKNISFDIQSMRLGGAIGIEQDLQMLEGVLKRFAVSSKALMENLFPHYRPLLIQARTSFRPAAVSNRKTSYRKDDRLLHVDAFPATPNQGMRILRVFSNVNTHNEPRVWHVGEPFTDVARTFLPKIMAPLPGKHDLMKMLGLTKTKRSLYDHYMLNIHHQMKKDKAYQQKAIQEKLELPAGSTWVVATDQVSHAALSGQHMLEQTFYLPVEAMVQPDRSPLRVLEDLLNETLV